MRKSRETEVYIINIQIGCILRLARLSQKLSQHTLAGKLEYNSTMIGRIERFESISGWDKILTLSEYLNINYCELFVLKNRATLLTIVDNSFKLEEKLTQEKIDYYSFLKKTINNKFDLLEKERLQGK
ncbi:helix-turn-helix domain-containing protein [Flavobacterium sp. AC]|uniref:Helix-turn-helix domain-containing protein n=1 Tax=Flavobacterium azizsancarii TaxID=2961580 RepID=A0ABT4WEP8_9FLAO|nr:helix-turn-helix transcriptional regulator [Flavobacterium azizsancarii]MDA6071070.1 helix-turn-helix domain-containing protein [Flavobacterium azizsancarii]